MVTDSRPLTDSRESSVLFSLRDLMALEEQRIAEEHAEHAAREARERKQREEEARAAHEAETRRQREEEEARQAGLRRQREGEARLEALKLAEAERARREVEQQGRLARLALEQEHEQRLVALRQDLAKKKLRRALAVTSAALVLGCVATGLVFADLAREHDSAMNQLTRHVTEARAALERNQAALIAQHAEKAAADAPPLPIEPQNALKEQPVEPEVRKPPPHRPPTTSKKTKDETKSTKQSQRCEEGDPLCPHL